MQINEKMRDIFTGEFLSAAPGFHVASWNYKSMVAVLRVEINGTI
jgi:hypothetical protein